MKLRQLDQRGAARSLDARCSRFVVIVSPGPPVPKPNRRQEMQSRRLWAAVPRGNANEHIFRGCLCILNKDIEIAVLLKDSRVDQFEFRVVPRAFCVLADKLIVGIRCVRILIEEFQVRTSRSGVEIVIVFLNVLAVVSFAICQAEQPLLEDWVFLIPERNSKADVLPAIANATDAVLAPAIGARTRMVVGQIVPRIAIGTVIFADRAPLPLG